MIRAKNLAFLVWNERCTCHVVMATSTALLSPFRTALLLLATAATTAMATGCAGTEEGDNEVRAQVDLTRTTRQKMVGGTVSTVAQDATVFLVNGDSSCSGSLIAENLVLTARHCVAEPQSSQTTDCVPYGATVQASAIQVKLGVSASFTSGQTVASGSRIFTSTTSNMCSFDVALIELDRPLTGAKIAPLRFSDLQPNEQTIAVGYGVDGNDKELPNRMQRTTNVLGVGPMKINYKTQQNTTLPYDLPVGDVATGESTCYGDSGGPLLDMNGNIVAITSRGINDNGEKGHGNGCIDEPSIYAGVKFNEGLIRQAAQLAGHPLPAGSGTQPQSTPQGRNTGNDDGADEEDPAGDTSSSNKDTGSGGDEDTGTKASTKKKSAAVQPASGCSVGTVTTTSHAPWSALVFAAGVVALRRRRAMKA